MITAVKVEQSSLQRSSSSIVHQDWKAATAMRSSLCGICLIQYAGLKLLWVLHSLSWNPYFDTAWTVWQASSEILAVAELLESFELCSSHFIGVKPFFHAPALLQCFVSIGNPQADSNGFWGNLRLLGTHLKAKHAAISLL